LGLYRANAEGTLKQVVTHISVRGIIELIVSTNNANVSWREGDDTPLTVAVTSSPSTSRLRLSSSLLHTVENNKTSSSVGSLSDDTRERPSLARHLSQLIPHLHKSKHKKGELSTIEQVATHREVSYQIRETTIALLTDLYVVSITIIFFVHIV
jgi:hypothetical protein